MSLLYSNLKSANNCKAAPQILGAALADLEVIMSTKGCSLPLARCDTL